MASILIVEDSLLSRRVFTKMLKAEGYEILEASSGPEALEILRTQTPDCMLLDLLMPEMEGREVLKIMRQQGLQIPTIVITADIQMSTRQECLDLGAIAVIHKIPNAEQVLGWVRKALNGSEDRVQ